MPYPLSIEGHLGDEDLAVARGLSLRAVPGLGKMSVLRPHPEGHRGVRRKGFAFGEGRLHDERPHPHVGIREHGDGVGADGLFQENGVGTATVGPRCRGEEKADEKGERDRRC